MNIGDAMVDGPLAETTRNYIRVHVYDIRKMKKTTKRGYNLADK